MQAGVPGVQEAQARQEGEQCPDGVPPLLSGTVARSRWRSSFRARYCCQVQMEFLLSCQVLLPGPDGVRPLLLGAVARSRQIFSTTLLKSPISYATKLRSYTWGVN